MDWLERLMAVHEGVCPDCGHDLMEWRLGGVEKFLNDHLDVLPDWSRAQAARNFLRGKWTPEQYAQAWAGLRWVVLADGAKIWFRKDEFSQWPHIDGWNPAPDGMGDVGLMAYRCPNVHEHQGVREYETWQGCGHDWTLTESTYPVGRTDTW